MNFKKLFKVFLIILIGIIIAILVSAQKLEMNGESNVHEFTETEIKFIYLIVITILMICLMFIFKHMKKRKED